MSAAQRHVEAEIKRCEAVITNPEAHPFEVETARKQLAKYVAARAKPIQKCPWCHSLEPHLAPTCPVIARWNRRNKGTMPTDGQAAELRAKMAQEDEDVRRGERRRQNKNRQQKLF